MSTAIKNPFCFDIFFLPKECPRRPGTLAQNGSSLENACWLYGVIGNAILLPPFLALLFVLTPDPGMTTMMHTYFAGIAAYNYWAFGKIWHFASGRDEDPRLALAAKIYVVIGGIQLAIFSINVIHHYAGFIL